MRTLSTLLIAFVHLHGAAQFDKFSFRHNYAFIEDGPTLTPLKGTYRVEYIGRGQYWTVTDPRWTVHHPGQSRSLTPCIKVNGAPLMVVEMGGIFGYPDNKLIVIRGADTMIVDLNQDGQRDAGEDVLLQREPLPATITARGALIYKDGGAAICVLDFGADRTSTTTFQVQFPANTNTSALIRIS